MTAEFSGCVLYAEIKKRVKNPDMRELFGFMSRDEARHAGFINDTLKDFGIGVDLGFLTQGEEVHLLQAEIHLLRDLSVREDRLRALHHHLPPSRAASRPSFHPIFNWFEKWCNDEFRHGEAFALLMRANPRCSQRHQQLWIRFFLLAVFATMYVRDHCGRPSTRRSGSIPTDYDYKVFRISLGNLQAGVPVDARSRHPRLPRGLDRLLRIAEAVAAGAQAGRLRRHRPARIGLAASRPPRTLVRLDLLCPTKPNALPATSRLPPATW